MAKKDEYIDPSTGKKYKLSDFDDSRSWSKRKKKVIPKDNLQAIPNILGRV